MAGDGLSTNMAGMTKNQLYDIMCQMKMLVEQNQQQARQILIQNPSLTRALFQAQIMLGMVQPAMQAIPDIPQTVALNAQPLASQLAQSNVQTAPSLPRQIGVQEQTRKQQLNQPAPIMASTSLPPSNLQTPSLPSRPVQQQKGHIGVQATPISLPQTSQVPHIPPPLSHHSASQLPPHLQPQRAPVSSQLEQPMQSGSNQHMPIPPQLPPPQVRPSMQPFPHQVHPHMGPNVGFPQPGPTQHHNSQPNYHPAVRPPASMGPSFLPGQPPIPSQLPPQPPYQMGGSHLRPEFNQGGSSMQADRVSPWTPGPPDNNTSRTQLPGPPPYPGQMGPSNPPPPRSAALTPEMEQALLDQVRSLTPEQVNMLPPEQRNQVLQLQQLLLR